MKNEYVKMMIVLTVIAAVCGFLLATVRDMTAPKIEQQIIKYVKAPALEVVLAGSDNEFLKDKRELKIKDVKHQVFIGRKDKKPKTIAFEGKAKGFKGDISIMAGFDIQTEQITGIRILTQKETPGLGARISENEFTDMFKGKSIKVIFKVKQDGGEIDAISGATNSSRAVCDAVEYCKSIFQQIKNKITEPDK